MPVNLALQIAHFCLENDVSLDDRSMLSVDDIISLVSLCLKPLFADYIPTSVWHCYGVSNFACGRQPGHGIHRGKGSFYIFISTCFLEAIISIKIKYWRFLNI